MSIGEKIALIVLLGIFLVLPILGALYVILTGTFNGIKSICTKGRQNLQRKHVIAESKLLHQLKAINSQYTFIDVQPSYSFTRKCISKNEYNKADPFDFFCIVAKENKKQLEKVKEQNNYNNGLWYKYSSEYDRLLGSIYTDGLGTNYRKTELEELENVKLHPCINPKIRIIISYKSPKGKKWANKVRDYSFDDLDKALSLQMQQAQSRREHKAMIEYERALMTEKMRYSILKRDNFRCVICGASASEDGVKLHVDHIKPVSKGGKTEESNLQTLCSRCNLGKSDS